VFKVHRLAAAVLSAAVVAASTGASAYAAVTHRAASGGATLTIAFSQEPDTLDPAVTGLTAVAQIDRNIVDTLIWITPNGKYTPDLATSWTITDGGKVYTFQLRHGVKFQDGTPFNAQAVVFNFERIMNPATKSIGAIGAMGPFQSAKAVGQYTVVVTMKAPYAPFLTNLGDPTLGMQSPTAIKKEGANYGLHPVGTGPFEVQSYTPNSSLVLVRNPDYDWAPPALKVNGPAKIAKLVFDIELSGQTRIDQILSGEAQAVDGTPALYYKKLGTEPGYTQFPVPIPGAGEYAVINNSKWPTNQLAVRQAILYYVNRQGLVALADQGVYPVIWGPLQPGTLGYTPKFNGMYAYSPTKGAEVLEKAGWKKVNGIWTKDGRQLTIAITNIADIQDIPDLAVAIQGYLQKAGMVATIRQYNDNAWHAANVKGVENITPLEFSSTDPDLLRIEFTPGQYFNWSKYNNPEVTKILDEAEVNPNPTSRLQEYYQAETILMDQAVMLPEHENDDLMLLKSNVKGIIDYFGGEPDYYQATL
jgi:peptide/nickel transport system substrate-binding protein